MLTDTLGELVQQIPPALILNVCVSGTLLMVALIYFVVIKPRRRKAREKAAEAAAGVTQQTAEQPATSTDPAATTSQHDAAVDYEMPDLDMLVDDTGFELEEEAKPEPAVTTGQATPPQANGRIRLNTGETVTAEELVSVGRDPRDGRLVVIMDGVGYRSLVDAPDVKARFVDVMRQLNSVVTRPDTLKQATDQAVSGVSAEKPEPPAVEAPPPVEKPKRVIDHEKILGSPPPPPKDGAIPGALPTYNMDEAVKPVRGGRFGLGPAKFEYADVPELDIAGSIEAYLQHRIAYTPEFQGRDIHVHAASGGGVRIQVDADFYDMVDEIEDDSARDFIAAVIAEWQSRQ